MSGRFGGKVALISGGGTGIGSAVARRLVDEGAHVVIMGRRQAQLDAVAGMIGAEVFVGDCLPVFGRGGDDHRGDPDCRRRVDHRRRADPGLWLTIRPLWPADGFCLKGAEVQER